MTHGTSVVRAALLGDLLEDLGCPVAPAPVEVRGLAVDSREVGPGDLFLAVAGSRAHGLSFTRHATDNGACAIVYDPDGGGEDLARSIRGAGAPPLVAVPQLGHKLGVIADRFFRSPSARLGLIGITGTDGKTSVSHFVAQALAETKRCAVIGTLGWGFPDDLKETRNTTPDAIRLQSMLAALEGAGAQAVSMEVSSHGLVQGRTQGVRFRCAVYTNISRDHLDYHGSVEAYIDAKLGLLRAPGLESAVVNLDDPNSGQILACVPDTVRTFGFTCKDARPSGVAVVTAGNILHGHEGLMFEVHYQGETASVRSALFGDFNVENLAATLTVLVAMGVPFDEAARRAGEVKAVPGRMERFLQGGQAPAVVVDYAHTPRALERILTCLRTHCLGALWVVFGCGGDRDRGKRAEMGAIAERWADRIVITDDNPRSEDANGIVQDILSGCGGPKVTVIRDRAEAIRTAIGCAGADDIVVVAGKGHESSQEVHGVRHPFSDRAVVLEALAAGSAHRNLRGAS